jgi:hypothetical protein
MTEGKLVGTNPGIGHNVGDGPSLSPKQEAILEKGRKTLADVTAHESEFIARRTFDFWRPIARAFQELRDVAKANRRFSFPELRERYGFDSLKKDRVSRLVKVIDNEVAVEAWRATLTYEQRRDWSSAEAIVRHCPDIPRKSPKPAAAPRKTRAALLKENAMLKAEIDRLNEHVRELEAARDHAGAAS